MKQKAAQMCVSVCTGLTAGADAFSITTVPAQAGDPAAGAGSLSAVGTTFTDANNPNNAVCLYDFLLIAGGRDANGVQADRYCGNALNPAPIAAVVPPVTVPPITVATPGGLPTSTQVCSKCLHCF
jgi:hypothetical protein